MDVLIWKTTIWTCFFFSVFNTIAFSQNNFTRVVEKLTPNVVAINVMNGDGTVNTGFGFIVAESGDRFFIVTAGHVIHSNQLQLNSARRISLQFYSQYVLTEGIELDWLESEDLSLLSCLKSKAVNWNPRFANFTPIAFERVTSIGKNHKWTIPGIGDINSINNPWIYFTMGALEPGCSGSPLLTDKGIVGMIVTDQEGSSKALRLHMTVR